jgi:lactoylglutathione lyase
VTDLNLLVIRARNPKVLARFYSLIGLTFAEERHGTGPEHLSCNLGGYTLEIYPLRKGERDTTGTRLGFRVASLQTSLNAILELEGASVLRAPELTKWGKRAVVVDPEGHKVELVESVVA